jgi:hypothetical protein
MDIAAAREMASPLRPYKPDDEERAKYCYGFAGNPRLVARTSNHRWSSPKHQEGWGDNYAQTPKRYSAIGEREPISKKWTKDLSLEIIKALNQCPWSYSFPIQIGLKKPDRTTPPSKFSAVLLVAVEPDSLQ